MNRSRVTHLVQIFGDILGQPPALVFLMRSILWDFSCIHSHFDRKHTLNCLDLVLKRKNMGERTLIDTTQASKHCDLFVHRTYAPGRRPDRSDESSRTWIGYKIKPGDSFGANIWRYTWRTTSSTVFVRWSNSILCVYLHLFHLDHGMNCHDGCFT
jgi:hypothetical protein